MNREELIFLAKTKAAARQLYPELVCAICEQESAWNPWAIRYEPAFYERYTKPLHLSDSEEYARAISWGLMQVMGQVAREFGFGGAYLAELCDPEVGLEIGCAVLAHKLAAAEGNVTKALLLWNGGGNPDYAQQVLDRAEKFKEKK